MTQGVIGAIDWLFRIVRGGAIADSLSYSPQKLDAIAGEWMMNMLVLAVLMAAACVVWEWRRKDFTKTLLILTIIDLFVFSTGNLVSLPLKITREESPALNWLIRHAGIDRYLSTSGNFAYTGLGVYWTHLRVREPFSPNGFTDQELLDFANLRRELQSLPENQGIASRVFDASGYAAAIPAVYLKYWQEEPQSPNAPRIDDLTSPKLNELSTRYIVTGYPQDFVAVLSEDRYRLIFESGETKIYQNQAAFPRAFLQNNPAVPVTISGYLPSAVTLKSAAREDSTLVLTDTMYPGWEAYVDQKAVPISGYKNTLRAIPVPKGEHTIEFFYRPRSFILGAIISLAAAAGVGIVLLWPRTKS